jgi:methylenetetrahydrofolate dehydrogenase (NADP+)/methenyltetrahydrofolate cyclohydrolase
VGAKILDGRAVAAEIVSSLEGRVAALAVRPGLAVVLVGEDPASVVYVRNKGKAAARLRFDHRQIDLPASVSEKELLSVVAGLNEDPSVHGILVQSPLPKHIDADAVTDAVDPAKDVDGFHPLNVGLLVQGRECLVPCTPSGVMELLRRTGEPLAGREALVIGRSRIVGKPMTRLLERADCTVTVAHSKTKDLEAHVRRAEVLVAAAGSPRMVRGAWVREGARVIDVGINRLADGSLVGDVEFEEAANRASWITPVPGGVGPMTIAFLMVNTVLAAERLTGGGERRGS